MIRKIVVIGSSGQLGQEFKNNIEFNKKFHTLPFSKDECDISNYQHIREILQNANPDVVINCAAYTNVDKAENEQGLANKINNLAVENLAKLSNELDFIFIHFSTDYVFNKTIENPFKESDAKNPINFYGITKDRGEEKIINFARKFFIFRISWVYGLYGQNFPKTIIRLIKNMNELNVVNDQIGVPTSTKFIVNGITNILGKQEISQDDYGIYNFTPKGQCTWYDIALRVFKKYKNKKNCICKKIIPVSSDKFPTIAKRPIYSLLDNELIIRCFKIEINEWDVYFDDFLNEIDYENI